jgi:serine/threonine protein kinase
MAPEVLAGARRVTTAADVWAAGVLLLYMLVGHTGLLRPSSFRASGTPPVEPVHFDALLRIEALVGTSATLEFLASCGGSPALATSSHEPGVP